MIKSFKNLQLTIVASFFCVFSWAQNGKITGYVVDAVTGEPLINASVKYGDGKVTTADFDGYFSIDVPDGEYQVVASYVTYKSSVQKVTIKGNKVELRFELEGEELKEAEVVTDIAKPRETPVAYTNISAQQIKEQLGSKDLPLILNSTPGVYATSQGGGDGDARISIRGFNSQNVIVLIDGIPMNDMFNGRVFWTNWFGLDNVTRTMQVQRGLGASKLAIPAIGGTVNILTQGIDAEKYVTIRQEYGNRNNLRTLISASSGKLKGGWNIQGAVSFKWNEGWVDQLYSRMFFYYFKVNKEFKKHTLSLTTFGAPQESGQRSFLYDSRIEMYSKDLALSLGIDTSATFKERGPRYYQGWGRLRRTRPDEGGADAREEVINTTVNRFYKPVVSIQDFIRVNNRFYISLIGYASFGRGGGTQLNAPTASPLDLLDGQEDLQKFYNANAYGQFNNFVIDGDTLKRSNNFIRMNHNDHSWYGFLTTFEWKALENKLTLSGGVDIRYYNGRVYSTVEDLLGGDFITASVDQNQASNIKRRGDIIQQNISRDILWGGAFAMLEYKTSKVSAFLNVSTAMNAYKQYNHFMRRQLVLEDTILNIGYSDVVTYNGVDYNRDSEGLRVAQSDWFARAGFTVKGGANYNFAKHHNAFFNVGYFSRVPMFTFLVLTNNELVRDAKNERLTSVEAGYTFKHPKFFGNINFYYTLWDNKPTRVTLNDPDGNAVAVNANNMGARHMGVEIDFTWKIIKQLSLEGMASIGDWVWNKLASGRIEDENGNAVSEVVFDPRGVKVGDAAQHTYAVALRIEPIKRFYISPRINIFTHNYANFDPMSLAVTNLATGYGPNVGRQSWRLPNYYYIDINTGYGFNVKKKVKIDLRASFMNITDNLYISDAQNNGIGGMNTFDASAATVYVGLGFRYLGSISVTF